MKIFYPTQTNEICMCSYLSSVIFSSALLLFSLLFCLPHSLTSSQRFIPLMLMDTPPPPCLSNQKSIKNTSPPSLQSWAQVEGGTETLPALSPTFPLPHIVSLSLFLSHTASLFSSWCPSLSSKLRPPVYWKLATWFTRTENLIYIFFSSCILSFIY